MREKVDSGCAERARIGGVITMGVDLRLLPFDSDQGDWAYSHTIINCGQDYDLFDKIKVLASMPVPPKFSSFCGRLANGDTGYGNTQTTPYGEPLTFVLAEHLVNVEHDEKDVLTRAAWAYLKCLPPHTKVALYWH
jgi:hypothetical protein